MAETFRYPLTKLESSDDYLKITALEYKAPGFVSPPDRFDAPTAGDPNDIKKELDYFILPIPEDIKDTNAVAWGDSPLNPLQVAAGGLIQGGLESASLEAAGKKLTSAFEKVAKELPSGSMQKLIQSIVIKGGSNILLGTNLGLNDVFSRYAGAVTNSNIELIFSGVSLRQPFSFAFDMVPRSQREAQVIKQIIRKFKQYSAAKKQGLGTGSGLFLKAPEVFRLEYMSGGNRHPYLNRFKICALAGVSVNYTGSGTYATYSDGSPVNIILGLTFKELSPIYAEDYDTGIGTEGTGF
jgi:hypothetical protein